MSLRSARGGAGGLLSSLGGVVIRIRILMYPACILQDTRILMYLDVSQTYLHALLHSTCILIFYYMHVFYTYIPLSVEPWPRAGETWKGV